MTEIKPQFKSILDRTFNNDTGHVDDQGYTVEEIWAEGDIFAEYLIKAVHYIGWIKVYTKDGGFIQI